jgi:hypothetical protein
MALYAVWALWNITKDNKGGKTACVDTGAVPKLVLLTLSPYGGHAAYAKLVLISIANHSPEFRQLVIDAGFNPR